MAAVHSMVLICLLQAILLDPFWLVLGEFYALLFLFSSYLSALKSTFHQV